MHHRPAGFSITIDRQESRKLSKIGGTRRRLFHNSTDLKLHMSDKDLWSQIRMRRRFLLLLVFGVIPLCLRSVFFGVSLVPIDMLGDLSHFADETDVSRVPDVLFIGAQESGTAEMADWIMKHNQVCMPRHTRDHTPMKEVHFFDKDELYLHDVPYYAKHFSHCNDDDIVVDATPDYLMHSYRVRDLYNRMDDASAEDLKIVIFLRDPVSREFAWYNKLAVKSHTENPPDYVDSIFDDDGRLMSFEEYTDRSVLPKIRYSPAQHSKWLRRWLQHFDRKQILLVKYEDLVSMPESSIDRVGKFLGLKIDKRLRRASVLETSENDSPLPCEARRQLSDAFRPANKDLYELLKESEGPKEEQRPFPEFQPSSNCVPSTNGSKRRKQANPVAATAKQNNQKQGGSDNVAKKSAKSDVPAKRTTLFFAAHHKTGTSLSQLVAKRLASQNLVQFNETQQMNEQVLNKNSEGNVVKCVGTEEKQELRSYLHWPTWMIDKLWSQCVENWWENWPSLKSRTDQLISQCDSGMIDVLTGELRQAACGNDYFVVHFVRSPIDIVLSSYKYTRKGEEQWMHDKLEKHPRFTPSLCGEHSCQHMSIHEAVNQLPVCQGLILEMKLVSLEIIKQMLVGATLARADPEHHTTVNLSALMKSSEEYNNAWTKALKEAFPRRGPNAIARIVEALQEFDISNDPARTLAQSETETMTQMQCLFQDAEVRLLLNDPLVKQITSL